MNAKSLYEEDFHAWALEQARVLRELKPGAPLPNTIDLERVPDEVEHLGNEQRLQVESNLVHALMHLIKVAVLPDDPAARHWQQETNAFLANAERRCARSMAQLINIDALWAQACRRLAKDFATDDQGLPRLPEASPLLLADLVAADADPRVLAGRIRTTLPPASP
jgi:hypothetical protein